VCSSSSQPLQIRFIPAAKNSGVLHFPIIQVVMEVHYRWWWIFLWIKIALIPGNSMGNNSVVCCRCIAEWGPLPCCNRKRMKKGSSSLKGQCRCFNEKLKCICFVASCTEGCWVALVWAKPQIKTNLVYHHSLTAHFCSPVTWMMHHSFRFHSLWKMPSKAAL